MSWCLQVLDYDNTATTLLPLVATSYVLHAAGKAVWAAYEMYEAEKKEGRFGTLPELHASSSGLKALCTECAADGIEAARRACGGHGYSVLSGLPTLFASYVQNTTWEGDNNVLLLQVCMRTRASRTARHLGHVAMKLSRACLFVSIHLQQSFVVIARCIDVSAGAKKTSMGALGCVGAVVMSGVLLLARGVQPLSMSCLGSSPMSLCDAADWPISSQDCCCSRHAAARDRGTC